MCTHLCVAVVLPRTPESPNPRIPAFRLQEGVECLSSRALQLSSRFCFGISLEESLAQKTRPPILSIDHVLDTKLKHDLSQ